MHGTYAVNKQHEKMAPEVLQEGLKVMREQLGIHVSAVAHQMGIQSPLLDCIVRRPEEARGTNVVLLFGSKDAASRSRGPDAA